ncbi:protein of unknown function DUF421 [Caldalkalibacillus thermarum TA2.A1]|uniref:DUF421 domain-containing protein n=1 Tax=Caldalkalibacillus thermarum (strain TA2.A1) TaxID=986075 RepID=F5LAQ8_CALTT|nr:DUF421 domain-containing protein [Caldalkalibacillus thermarum]EGL81630.1 protein of unknown function DUF421 [Caldalkalibacillus thermarum TA2.A1]QZT33485.1 DUF421 domain-containing protein [Caldalkalibacillus thermarum TA2.A1]
MDLVALVLRTLFVYFFILLVMRMMGKREIGKLSIFDLVVSIMIADLAVLAVEHLDVPLFFSLVPIVVLFLTQIGLSYISLKSKTIREIVDGKPSVLIENGQIREEEMKKQRYNLSDLLMQLREKNIYSLSQVEFAILEPTGKLTVIPREEEKQVTKKDLNLPVRKVERPVILIEDGEVNEDNLNKIGRNVLWLKQQVKKRTGISRLKDVSFCSLDTDGVLYIDLKDQRRK